MPQTNLGMSADTAIGISHMLDSMHALDEAAEFDPALVLSYQSFHHGAVQIPVVCNGKEGMLLYPARSVICSCTSCAGMPISERTMRCTVFEAHCGRGTAKKWMDSILVTAPDAMELCKSE